jgi:hypothetical protein
VTQEGSCLAALQVEVAFAPGTFRADGRANLETIRKLALGRRKIGSCRIVAPKCCTSSSHSPRE